MVVSAWFVVQFLFFFTADFKVWTATHLLKIVAIGSEGGEINRCTDT